MPARSIPPRSASRARGPCGLLCHLGGVIPFSLTRAGTLVPGSITCVGAVATFTPSTPLAEGVSYNVALTTGVRDLANNRMLQAQAWSFTTANTAPVVASKSPANGGVGVGVMVGISATFSEPMSIPTLNSTTFTV